MKAHNEHPAPAPRLTLPADKQPDWWKHAHPHTKPVQHTAASKHGYGKTFGVRKTGKR